MKQPTLQEKYNLIKKGQGDKRQFLQEARTLFPDKVRNNASFEEVEKVLKSKKIINENVIGIEAVNLNNFRKKEVWEEAFDDFIDESKPYEAYSYLNPPPNARFYADSNEFMHDINNWYDNLESTGFQGTDGKNYPAYQAENNEIVGVFDRTRDLGWISNTTLRESSLLTENKKQPKTKAHDPKDKDNPDNMIFDQYKNGVFVETKKNPDKSIEEIKKIVEKNLKKDPLYYLNNASFNVEGLKYETELPGLGTPKEPKGKHKSSGYGTLNENQKFIVTRKGGSIGEKSFSKEFSSKEEANAYAKSMNKGLSPGEKSYYKIKYVVKKSPNINEDHYKTQTGLIVTSNSFEDYRRIGEILNSSELYAEEDKVEEYWFLSEEEETYDALERRVDELLGNEGLSYRIEGAFPNQTNDEPFSIQEGKKLLLEENETRSIGPQHKPKEDFQVGDVIKYKGMNHKITRILDDGRIYIKSVKHSGRPDTWVKSQDIKKSKTINEYGSSDYIETYENKNVKKMIKLTKILEETRKESRKKEKPLDIKGRIKEIEKTGSVAALGAKIEALDEEINNRESKLNMVIENEDFAEFINQGRVKEMQREIKELQKAREKYNKLYERLAEKPYTPTITEDEINLNENEDKKPSYLKSKGDTIKLKSDDSQDLKGGTHKIEDVKYKDGEWVYKIDGSEYSTNYIHGKGGYWKESMIQ